MGGVGYMSMVGDYRRGWLLSIARDGSVAVLVQQVTGWVALASLRRLCVVSEFVSLIPVCISPHGRVLVCA